MTRFLPSLFIQQVPSCVAARAWILLIDLTIFFVRVHLEYWQKLFFMKQNFPIILRGKTYLSCT